MAIYANTIINDALALIDVVAPGEDPEAWWSQLATRHLNGLISEWSLKGLYNVNNLAQTLYPTTTKAYFTLGVDDSVTTLSAQPYSIVETADVAGAYYKSIDGTIISYSIAGAGTRYNLTVTQDTAGTFYQVAGGYSQQALGDIPVNFSNISSVQLDLGSVVYNPTQVTMAEYMSMSVKRTQATPMYWAWDYQQPVSKLYFWPMTLPNMTLRVIGQPTIDAIASNTSKVPLDRMYYDALVYSLATSLYPYRKRATGIDTELVYKTKAAMSVLRSRVLSMVSRKVVVPYGSGAGASDYWTSPLNTVNTGSN
jgi:hypothetical protein